MSETPDPTPQLPPSATDLFFAAAREHLAADIGLAAHDQRRHQMVLASALRRVEVVRQGLDDARTAAAGADALSLAVQAITDDAGHVARLAAVADARSGASAQAATGAAQACAHAAALAHEAAAAAGAVLNIATAALYGTATYAAWTAVVEAVTSLARDGQDLLTRGRDLAVDLARSGAPRARQAVDTAAGAGHGLASAAASAAGLAAEVARTAAAGHARACAQRWSDETQAMTAVFDAAALEAIWRTRPVAPAAPDGGDALPGLRAATADAEAVAAFATARRDAADGLAAAARVRSAACGRLLGGLEAVGTALDALRADVARAAHALPPLDEATSATELAQTLASGLADDLLKAADCARETASATVKLQRLRAKGQPIPANLLTYAEAVAPALAALASALEAGWLASAEAHRQAVQSLQERLAADPMTPLGTTLERLLMATRRHAAAAGQAEWEAEAARVAAADEALTAQAAARSAAAALAAATAIAGT